MESLASKWRPQVFADVVGQDNIKAILQSQIRQSSIKQAYLFTGGAGTGKTTTARIFANEINEHKGSPIEIDAASNNGVDQVREIRDGCKFKPLDSKYKVYIIDEVHMLSTGAFNALLKTLEEPPAHAVFILATTDPQKILATILSRVQRFDFKRMTVPQVTGRLTYILRAENDQADPTGGADMYDVQDAALEYLAKLSNGGMRDAITLLDTCLGYKPHLDLPDVFEILGTTDYFKFLHLVDYVTRGDMSLVWELVEEAHLSGKDLKAFVRGAVEFVVELMKVELLADWSVVSIPAIYQHEIDDMLNGSNRPDLPRLFKDLNGVYNRLKYEHQPKVLLQGELMSLCADNNI